MMPGRPATARCFIFMSCLCGFLSLTEHLDAAALKNPIPLSNRLAPNKEAAGSLLQCKAHLTIVTPGLLGVEHRLPELRRLEAGFRKAFPNAQGELEAAFGKVISGASSDSRYHWHVEELALKLNHLMLAGKALSPAAQALWQSWQDYPSPSIRAPHAIDKHDECIESSNPSFSYFTKATLLSIKQYFAKISFTQSSLAIIPEVQLLAAGSYSPFGATASSLQGHPRVCINPEEAPPLLIPKLLHELTHANNSQLWPLRDHYLQAYERWRAAAKQLEEKEHDLYNFDGEILASAQERLEADVIMAPISRLETADLSKVRDFLKAQAPTAPSYKVDRPQTIDQHALLVLAWTKQQREVASLAKEQLSQRELLDRARFVDEHRGYAAEYLAAMNLLAADPGFYCQLWVPSYPQKRPVRFYQAYQDVETKIRTRAFSNWLADLYTRSGKYLPSSLYIDGNEKKGLQLFLLNEGSRILREQLNGHIPVIPRPQK